MAKKFLTDIKIAAGVYDSSGDIGNSGQVLSSTGSGVNWINTTTSASVIYQDGFTGDGSTTAFTLANSIDNENKTQVYIDGVYQHKDTFSLSGTTLTFSTAPPNTTDIEVISFSSVTAADDILYDNDFSSAGLMTTNGSGVYSITTNNSSNWNTAYTYSQVGHLPLAGGAITGAITTNSTFDGRDVSVDGTKLDGIEASATADQTDAEIRTAVEAATDSNVFTDADHTKLNAIEASATADQTAAEIRVLVEAATDSNVFTDADHTKLNAIEASADVTDTVNVTAAGALMDSELTDLAGIKAVTISDLATETYVDTAVSDLVDSSPATLNTLNELAAALGDDPNFATTTANSIGLKAPLASPTFTGTVGISATIPRLNFTDLQQDDWAIINDNGEFKFQCTSGSGVALQLATNNNATFAGSVTASNYNVSNTSGYLVREDSGSGYGLFKSSTSNIGIASNGIVALNIDSSGQIIFKGTGNGVDLRFKDISAAISSETAGYIGMSTSAYSGNNGDLVLIPRTSSASNILLMQGNVGIGTTSPSNLLDIKSNGSSKGLDIHHSNGNMVAQLIHGGSGDEGQLKLYDSNIETVKIAGESGVNSFINSGNVGIGVTNPSSKFTVEGAPANGIYLSYLYNSATHSSANGLNVQTSSNNILTYGLRINTAGDSNALAVMGNGKVGIGTASPVSKLHVSDTNTVLTIESTTGGQNCSTWYKANGNNQWETGCNIAAGTDYQIYDRINSASRMVVGHNGNVTIPGNVGIGTTSPLSPLTVHGQQRWYTTNSDGNELRGFFNPGGSGDPAELSLYQADGTSVGVELRATGNSYFNGGNVGIGTTSPQSNLDIKGSGNTAINSKGNLFVSSGGTVGQAAGTGGQISFGSWLNGDLSQPYPLAAIRGVAESSTTNNNRGALIFGTMDSNTAVQERMRITSDGDISLNGGILGFGRASSTPTIGYGMFHYSGIGLGIYSSAGGGTQGIGFWLNNGSAYEAGRWLQNGNLGIGTTSPSSLLTLNKATGEVGILLEGNGTDVAKFKLSSAGVNHAVQIGSVSNNEVQFHTANSEKMRLAANGNVGIGTTGPVNKLGIQVAGQSNTKAINIYSLNTSPNSYTSIGSQYSISNAYVESEIRFGNETQSGGGSYLGFVAGGSNLGNTEKMRITSAGNIGIGTTSPVEMLHVNKNATSRIVGAYFTNSQANTGAEAVSIAFGLNRSGGDFVRKVEAIEFGALQQWTGTPSTVNSYLAFNVTKSESLYERMRVTTDGIDVTSYGAHGIHLKPDTADTNNSGRLLLTRVGGSGWAVMNNSQNFSIRSGAVPASTSGTEKIRLTGYSATSWTSGSDETIKENIKPIGNVLDKINDYRCVEYNLIDDETKDKKIGFIAQDWQEDFPQIIEQMENEKIGMKYTETIPILLKAIQELKAEIETLKTQIDN